jgi:hypothetical protein
VVQLLPKVIEEDVCVGDMPRNFYHLDINPLHLVEGENSLTERYCAKLQEVYRANHSITIISEGTGVVLTKLVMAKEGLVQGGLCAPPVSERDHESKRVNFIHINPPDGDLLYHENAGGFPYTTPFGDVDFFKELGRAQLHLSKELKMTHPHVCDNSPLDSAVLGCGVELSYYLPDGFEGIASGSSHLLPATRTFRNILEAIHIYMATSVMCICPEDPSEWMLLCLRGGRIDELRKWNFEINFREFWALLEIRGPRPGPSIQLADILQYFDPEQSLKKTNSSDCGNGVIDPGERCGEPGATCRADTEYCFRCSCHKNPVCNNGIIEDGEECDMPDYPCPVVFPGCLTGSIALTCNSNCKCQLPTNICSADPGKPKRDSFEDEVLGRKSAKEPLE